MASASEVLRYNVTSSLILWAHEHDENPFVELVGFSTEPHTWGTNSAQGWVRSWGIQSWMVSHTRHERARNKNSSEYSRQVITAEMMFLIKSSGRFLILKQTIRRSHNYATAGTTASFYPWWRHQMETFSTLLAICAGNSPVPVNSPHKGQWHGAFMFSLICAWITVE